MKRGASSSGSIHPKSKHYVALFLSIGLLVAVVALSYSIMNDDSSGILLSPNIGTDTPNTICIDSDDGLNYNVRGYVEVKSSDGSVVVTDWDNCEVELFCNSDGTKGTTAQVCANGCNNGVCIN